MIERPRLHRLAAHARRLVLEAPGGFGKTTFARAIALAEGAVPVHVTVPEGTAEERDPVPLPPAIRRALAEAGIRHSQLDKVRSAEELGAALDAAIPTGTTLVLLIDEAQRLTDSDIPLVVELGRSLAGRGRLVVAGRRIAEVLRSGADLVLGPDDLAFAIDEVRTDGFAGVSPVSESAAYELIRLFNGWPAAVAAAACAWGSNIEVRARTAAPQTIFANVTEELLNRLDPEKRVTVEALARLPVISADVCDQVAGAGSWLLLRSSGIPLSTCADGWWKIADPVRDVIAARFNLHSRNNAPAIGDAADQIVFLERAAVAYCRAGRVIDGLRLLAGGGLSQAAATLLIGLTGEQLETLELSELRAVVHSLGLHCIAQHPAVHLAIARLAGVTGDIAEHLTALELADQGALLLGDDVLRRAVAADRIRTHARSGEAFAALELGARVLAAAGEGELITRARCLSGMGLAEATLASPGSTYRAAAYLTESAASASARGRRA